MRPFALIPALLLGLTACIPASPVAPTTSAARTLPVGSYYLRSIDGRTLPTQVESGVRIESGFVVADTSSLQLVGWGESVTRVSSTSVHLATGHAQVLSEDAHMTATAAITWEVSGAGVRADSVSWSADSVIVHRTGAGPSVAGAGHRLVYTRAVAADTL